MPLEPAIPIDDRNRPQAFAGYLFLVIGVVFAGMTGVMFWGIRKSYNDNAVWDGQSCCDPLEDIGVLWAIAIFSAFVTLSAIVVAQLFFSREVPEPPR